jgi:glycosyltransferase involved in cell wall biosynthesis
MCTFNGGRFLLQQLESIAAQERLPDELVVSDDGSTDSSLEIVQTFADRVQFPVRIFRNGRRLGSTGNFEKAIQLCDGEFIALCDQDDVWKPDKLARLSGALWGDITMGGVFSDADLVDEAGDATGKRLWQFHKFRFAHPDDFERNAAIQLLLKHDVVTGATLMFRASLRDVLLPIPEPWVHDGWIAWMLVLHSRLTFVSEPLLWYRVHPGQQLGLGRPGWQKRIFHSDEDRKKLCHMTAQFEALRDRWLARPGPKFAECLDLIENKLSFLRRRKRLPLNPAHRACAIFSLSQSYRQYARGFSSMRGDLFLRPDERKTCLE